MRRYDAQYWWWCWLTGPAADGASLLRGYLLEKRRNTTLQLLNGDGCTKKLIKNNFKDTLTSFRVYHCSQHSSASWYIAPCTLILKLRIKVSQDQALDQVSVISLKRGVLKGKGALDQVRRYLRFALSSLSALKATPPSIQFNDFVVHAWLSKCSLVRHGYGAARHPLDMGILMSIW